MMVKLKPLRLWQEILLTLLLKAVLLAIIWAAWFSKPEDRAVDDQKAATQILSRPTR